MIVFEGTGVNVTDVGKRYLGGVRGSGGFLAKFAESKISDWTREIERLSDLQDPNHMQHLPHLAMASVTDGHMSPGWYLSLKSVSSHSKKSFA